MARSNTAPAWRRAFLRELGRSGSVALAAEKAGIDRSSAYQVRKRNAAFAASWERALEAAREGLDGESALTDPKRPPFASSEVERRGRECVSTTLDTNGKGGPSGRRPTLRPNETVRSSKAGRPCIVRVGPGRWSAKSERAFLEELTASANVKAAARAAGVSAVAAYNRRRQWPAFAEAWAEAKAEGWQRIEMLLIHAATTTLDPDPSPEEARQNDYAAPTMSVEQAMKLWLAHRASQQGGKPQRYGWRRQEPDIEDVRAEILRKVEAIERARGSRAQPLPARE